VRVEPAADGVTLVHRADPSGADDGGDVAAALAAYTAQCLPGVVLDPEGPLVTRRPAGPVVLDRVGRVVVGVGLGAHGVALAPGAGQLLADLAEDALGVPRQLGDDDDLDRSTFSLAAATV
jgi:glycine/D-amino acid oxidase-like deaminating enzyme